MPTFPNNIALSNSGAISTDSLATSDDITNGTAGKVVDAAQLKSSLDEIQEVLDEVRTYTLLLNGL